MELDLIGLVGEKNTALRKRCEQLWNQRGSVGITTSEWFLLSRIGEGKPSVSELARSVDMTRQAVHKLLGGLQAKGLLVLTPLPGNKRARSVSLTSLGAQSLAEYSRLKRDLEARVAFTLGPDNILRLKELLQADWLGGDRAV